MALKQPSKKEVVVGLLIANSFFLLCAFLIADVRELAFWFFLALGIVPSIAAATLYSRSGR